MRRTFLIISIFTGILVLGLFSQGKFWGDKIHDFALPGLNMEPVSAGTYNLTILVPNSLGRKYYSKRAKIRDSFLISQHEITIEQWNLCYQDGGCSKQAKQRPYQTGSHPVTLISWYDAISFTRWLSKKSGKNFRLPTEEEWAYVAFAGRDFTKEVIEGLIDKRRMIQVASMSRFRKTSPVGGSGQNAWKIYDMTGPVWEWTLTCWFSSDEENKRPWTIAELSNPELCPNRIVQGDERAHVPFFVDKVYTGGCGTGSPVDHIGFRVVQDVTRS